MIQLTVSPRSVQTSETTIGVSCSDTIVFYEMKTRTLKYKYHTYLPIMNNFDSIFCGPSFGKLVFFDSDGNYFEEMNINKKRLFTGFYPVSAILCSYKDNLYMADHERSQILIF